MAVRSTKNFAGLLLADPLGIKVGGTLDRDITDMHAIPRSEFMRLAWANPDNGAIDYTKLEDTELAGIARGREALAVFGWKPYMHNPRLKRWLHRIDIPTHLIWGEQDGIVTTAYGEAWKAEIPGATLETIPHAGHYPHWEQPEKFAACTSAFTQRL
jgi:pimeloyl-ACP methyl ester carboxylesterase